MSDREDAHLGPRDRELVEWVARHCDPPAQTPARSRAFTESLRVRLESRRRWVLAPAVAAVATACLVWWALPAWSPSAPSASAVDSAWEYEILLSSDVSPTADRDESQYLPDDYQAIAAAFLGS